jgi:hypothetical protein
VKNSHNQEGGKVNNQEETNHQKEGIPILHLKIRGKRKIGR